MRNRRFSENSWNGDAVPTPWQMVDRLALMLAQQKGDTCVVYLRDLIYPAHANNTNTATAKVTVLYLFPTLFPESEWGPVSIEYNTFGKRRYNYRVVFRRRRAKSP